MLSECVCGGPATTYWGKRMIESLESRRISGNKIMLLLERLADQGELFETDTTAARELVSEWRAL